MATQKSRNKQTMDILSRLRAQGVPGNGSVDESMLSLDMTGDTDVPNTEAEVTEEELVDEVSPNPFSTEVQAGAGGKLSGLKKKLGMLKKGSTSGSGFPNMKYVEGK
jgi:hypothetical protein